MKIYIPSSMFKLALEELKAYNVSGKWFTNDYYAFNPIEIVEIGEMKPLLTENEKARKDTSLKRKARKALQVCE